MTSITVRNVPEAVRDELAARAARTGRSLQEYLRGELIQLAKYPEPATLMSRVRERKKNTQSSLTTRQILSHRDADRP